MQSNTSKIVLAVIVTAIIVGGGVYYWQSSKQAEPNIATQSPATQSNLEIYSSEKYSFKYPKTYSVSSAGEERIETYSNKGKAETSKSNTYILTVAKGDTAKLEIFKASEYPVDRTAVGFSGEETPAEADAYIKDIKARSAKEYLKVGSYDVWLYYSENENQSKNEVKAIFDSIVLK